MASLTVCENHPRRTRYLRTVIYVDGHGICYTLAFCEECFGDAMEHFEDFVGTTFSLDRETGEYTVTRSPCDGSCGAGKEYHDKLRRAA